MEQINIMLAANRNYMTGLGLTLGSLIANYTGTTCLVFNLLISDWSDEDFRKLEQYLGESGGGSKRFLLKRLDSKWMDGAHQTSIANSHFSAESNARLFVCEMFPNVSKVYYLDSDLYFEWDFQAFLDVDTKNFPIAACEALGGYNFRNWKMGNKKFPLEDSMLNKKYFNAGVLVFDLTRCRLEGFDLKLKEATKAFSGKYLFSDGDQFVLNYVFVGRWVGLPVEFNKRLFLKTGLHPMVDEQTPGVFHFVGKEKPWDYKKPSRQVARRANQFLRKTKWYQISGLPLPSESTEGHFSDLKRVEYVKKVIGFCNRVLCRNCR